MGEKQRVAQVVSRLHLPEIDDPRVRPFFDGAAAGELRMPACGACGVWVWYPQAICPACAAEELRWSVVSGRGHIFTWVRVHRAFLPAMEHRVPYLTALVELEEDPSLRVPTILVGDDAREPAVGVPVRVEFERVSEAPEIVVPRFRMCDPEPRAAPARRVGRDDAAKGRPG